MKLIGDQADQVQVLFVTVDPERDTQAVLAKFVPSFDSRFIGLRGDMQQTAETVKILKSIMQKCQVIAKTITRLIIVQACMPLINKVKPGCI